MVILLADDQTMMYLTTGALSLFRTAFCGCVDRNLKNCKTSGRNRWWGWKRSTGHRIKTSHLLWLRINHSGLAYFICSSIRSKPPKTLNSLSQMTKKKKSCKQQVFDILACKTDRRSTKLPKQRIFSDRRFRSSYNTCKPVHKFSHVKSWRSRCGNIKANVFTQPKHHPLERQVRKRAR